MKRAGDGAAQRRGLRREREIEARRELHPAQHAQRVLDEGRAGVAQRAPREVALPVVRIDEVAGERIERDGVEREVAARRGLRVAERRIRRDGEAAMTGAGLGLAARQGEVVFRTARAAADLEHAEAAADDIGRAKGLQHAVQRLEVRAADLDVEVLRRDA